MGLILLWLLGIPIPLLLLIALFAYHKGFATNQCLSGSPFFAAAHWRSRSGKVEQPETSMPLPVCTENINSDVVVMKAAKHRA